MKDDDNRKRIVLMWEKNGESKLGAPGSEADGEATVAVTPLGDGRAPMLRIVSSGFGQSVRGAGAGRQPTASLRCAA
jgi:hypothetical protein